MSLKRTSRNAVAAVTVAGILSIAVPAAAVEVVEGDGARWRPATVSVDRHEAVRWTAVFRAHVVRSYGGGWTFRRRIAQGASVRRTFDARGTFRFYCTIHGTLDGRRCTGMCGKVVV